MIRVAIFLIAVALIASAAVAQSEPPSERAGTPSNPSRPPANMKDTLDLSDEQVEQIRQLRRSGGSREAFRAILTPQQRSTLDEYRARRQAQRAQRIQRNRDRTMMPGATEAKPESGDG